MIKYVDKKVSKRRLPVLPCSDGPTPGTITFMGRAVPVIGYVNCTGKPLPGDAANSAAISAFLARENRHA